MAITRRQFIKRAGALTAGTLLGPGLWSNRLVRQAFAGPMETNKRYFIIIFLDGGNDGLNTVVPRLNGTTVNGTSFALRTAYEAARGTGNGGLRISQADLLPTVLGPNVGTEPNSDQIALHPGLIGLWNLSDASQVGTNQLAVIQGCGYPNYSLSHDESRNIWRTGNPLGLPAYTGTGWGGRYLAANYGSTSIPGVTISDSVAPEYRQLATSVLAISRLRDFGFPYDEVYSGDDAAKRAAFLSLCSQAGSPPGNGTQTSQIYIGDSGNATLLSSEAYGGSDPGTLDAYYRSNRSAYNDAYSALDTSTARNLREIAKIVYGVERGVSNVNARFFQLANGGYDTHSDQGTSNPGDQHYDLHREIGDALWAFYQDLSNMNPSGNALTAWERTAVLVWSEFSRRIPQNDNGTDHGSQGPMFVVGGSVSGKLYGRHADINNLDDDENTRYSQDNSNPFRSTDFRDVYGTVLKHWLGMSNPGLVLPVDSVPSGDDPNDYWTVPNFDMGFL